MFAKRNNTVEKKLFLSEKIEQEGFAVKKVRIMIDTSK